MRATLLLIVVLCFMPIALFRPKWGLAGYLFFALARPDILAFAPSGRLSLLLAVATLVGSLPRLGNWIRQLRNPFVLLLGGVLAMFWIATVFAVVPGVAYPRFYQFVRASTLAVAIPVLFVTAEDILTGMLAVFAGLGLIAVKWGLYGLLHGGIRFSGGYGGMLSDNNTLALGLVMAVPFGFYAMWLVKPRYRPALLVTTFFLVTTMVLTFSRGAALSFGVLLLMIVQKSKHRVTALVVIVVLLVPALLLVGSAYFNRIETIGDYDSDNSIRGRLNNAKTAIEMWKDYPIHGVGFGMVNQQLMWPQYVSRDEVGYGLVVHNTYLQLLTDSGILGLLSYVTLMFSAIWWLGRSIKKTRRLWPGKEAYPIALRASLVTCVVGTIFLSRIDFDLTYMVLMLTAAWWNVSNAQFAAMRWQEVERAYLDRSQALPARVRLQPSGAPITA